MKKIFPLSFYNPLTLGGSAIAAVSFALILFLMLLEMLARHQKPYMGIIAFVIMPAFLILGLVLIGIGIVRESRRERAGAPAEIRLPSIDLNNPRHRVAFLVFSVGTILLLMFTAFGSFKAYEYTDSNQFCGEACHKVMEPEYAAFRFSPHARVDCVQCHIGPGADWFVQSKMSGTYQLYATILHKYPRPISTPIKNLRPAQDTCEQCHWPKYFFSEKLKVNTYFLSDDVNARWTLTLLMKIGGGDIERGPTSGIHWHMNIANEVYYRATDSQRLVIPWIRVRKPDGTERIYRSTETAITDSQLQSSQERRMDCIDCHNRPTHIFHPPSALVNRLMALGSIDPLLPNVKAISVRALESPYRSTQEGLDGIRRTVDGFYRSSYPDAAAARGERIERAIIELQNAYSRNYFPSMRVSWRAYPDHIGHMYSPGCFRCHDGRHVSNDGNRLSRDCGICHTILAQQFEKEALRVSLGGVSYRHPVDVGEAWEVTNCSDCHGGGGESGVKP